MNFILYDNDIKAREQCKKLILKLMGPRNEYYRILEFDSYTTKMKNEIERLSGHCIFLLEDTMEKKSGFELARTLRKSGDWHSQIIILTKEVVCPKIADSGGLLLLDFVSKVSDFSNHLMEVLQISLEVLGKCKAYRFLYHGELHQIPYHEILYIEKELDNNNAIIVTEKREYKIRRTIQQLLAEFSEDESFFQTHRSCIVHLKKVVSVDFDQNCIHFQDKMICLLSRDKKRKLKEKLKTTVSS